MRTPPARVVAILLGGLLVAVCLAIPKRDDSPPVSYDELMRRVGQTPRQAPAPAEPEPEPRKVLPVPAAPVAPIPTRKLTAAERRAEIESIRDEIRRLQNIGASIMDDMRGAAASIKQVEKCGPLRERHKSEIETLEERRVAIAPDDFHMKVAVGTLRLCVACSNDAAFHCEQVAGYLKKGKLQ